MAYRQRARGMAATVWVIALLAVGVAAAPVATAADPLPLAHPAVVAEAADPTAAAAAAAAAANPNPAPLLGFDTSSAPSSATMRAWSSSPYRAVGVYLAVTPDSDNRFDKVQANLTPGWVSDVRTLGWSLLPIYLGKQAPAGCQPRNLKHMSGDSGTAAGEGRAAADDAVSSVSALGLPIGSPIYYDMEAYNNGCSGAV